MKIIFSILTLTKGKGGAEKTAVKVANEMVKRGHEVLVYADADEDEQSSYTLVSEIELLKVPYDDGKNLPVIRERLSQYKADVGFIFYYNLDVIKQYSMLEGIVPIGVQECTNPIRQVANFNRSKQVSDIFEAFSIRESLLASVQGIRFVLPEYAKYIPKGVSAEKVMAFPNAFQEQSLHGNPDQANKKIICVGGLKATNKNGLALIRAFALIKDNHPDWTVHFYGGEGLGAQAKAVINRQGLEGKVFMHGYCDDMESVYAEANIHVICSYEEGCPNVVCESMTFAVPSVGFSDCMGTNSILLHEENGLLVSRENEARSLSIALDRLMSDDQLRHELGQNALKSAAMFDPNTIYDKWEILFSKIAEQKDKQKSSANELECENSECLKHLEDRWSNISKKLNSEDETWPLVSFVIPLYNKEKYIAETITSIVNNDYPNKEIIVVDDCSTDISHGVVINLGYEDVLILSHTENRGLSAARNTGLEKAKGKYIQFWDADDVYSDCSLKEIIKQMEEDGSDIGTGLATRSGRVLEWYMPSNISRRRTGFAECPESFSASSTCFKLYKRSFLQLNNIKFVEGLYMQDTEFNLRAFPLANTITVTQEELGHYRKLANSAGKAFNKERIESCFKMHGITSELYEDAAYKEFESFRQYKLLKFVFRFFVRQLLNLHIDYNEKDINLTSVEIAEYLDKFSNVVGDYQKGIRVLLDKGETGLACMYLALINKHYDLAYKIISKSKHLPKGYQGCLITSEFCLDTINNFVFLDASAINAVEKTHKVTKEVNSPRLSRKGRLWRKFRTNPYKYFLDSKVAYLRPLRFLFKKI